MKCNGGAEHHRSVELHSDTTITVTSYDVFISSSSSMDLPLSLFLSTVFLSITFSSLISKKILVPFSSIFYIPLHSFFIFSIWMEKWYGFSNIYFFIWQNMAHPPISFKSYKELMFLSPFFLRSHFSIWNWQVGQTIVIPLTVAIFPFSVYFLQQEQNEMLHGWEISKGKFGFMFSFGLYVKCGLKPVYKHAASSGVGNETRPKFCAAYLNTFTLKDIFDHSSCAELRRLLPMKTMSTKVHYIGKKKKKENVQVFLLLILTVHDLKSNLTCFSPCGDLS